MSDPDDWKQKYRDSVLEMEREEKRWRQVEQALRRLIGRLCAAGMGTHAELDSELMALAAANRRNAAADELERLAASLTIAVVAADAVPPATAAVAPPTAAAPVPAGRWTATCAAAAKILNCLRALSGEDAAATALLQALPRAGSDAELAAMLEQTADLVQRYGNSLAQERTQAAAVLGDVRRRLEEVSGYLAEAGREARSRWDDTASVNDSVISEVRELRAEVDSATELRVLQSLVNARLETVTQQVLAFRSREENRILEQSSRSERMRARIADLERETQDLNSKLDREKHGARLDPLTRLANRKSFDERIAQELARRSQGHLPVTLLVWDLDNFKAINDTYGHRAGDRVLQSVASCFLSGIRGEDFAARIGGEEFVMLLIDLSFDKARQIADELRDGVAALRFHFRGTPVRVTVSCGMTELRVADDAAAAFDRADAALYRAKHAGKNVCMAA